MDDGIPRSRATVDVSQREIAAFSRGYFAAVEEQTDLSPGDLDLDEEWFEKHLRRYCDVEIENE